MNLAQYNIASLNCIIRQWQRVKRTANDKAYCQNQINLIRIELRNR